MRAIVTMRRGVN